MSVAPAAVQLSLGSAEFAGGGTIRSI
jgi:hypothetical protein